MTVRVEVSAIVEMLGLTADVAKIPTPQVLEFAGEALFRMGFEGARYFNYSQEVVPDLPSTSTVYLAWQGYTDGPRSPRQNLGYSIEWSNTSLSENADSNTRRVKPVVRSDHGDSESSEVHKWVTELGLRGRTWIDIAVHDQVKLLGLLQVDWAGSPSEVSVSDLEVLSLFGSVLGGELSATTPRISDALEVEFDELSKSKLSNDDFVAESVRRLHAAVGASTSAVFKYDWSRKCLSRRSWAEPPEPSYNEMYMENECLTGVAWSDDRYHRISDFGLLAKARPNLVNADSYNFHQATGGEITSILYGRIGDDMRTYLVRLVNTKKDQAGPFIFEQETFDQVIKRLSQLYDARINAQRAETTANLLDLLSRHAPPKGILGEVRRALQDIENVESFVVVALRAGDKRPYFYHGLSPQLISEIRDDVVKDAVFTRAATSSSFMLRFSRRGVLAKIADLQFGHAHGVANFPFASGLTRGLLILPVYAERSRYAPSREARERASSIAFGHQLASIIGQSLEDEIIRVQSTHALRALSLVGHEMLTPLAAMTKLTEKALQTASRYSTRRLAGEDARPISPSYYNDLRSRIVLNTELLEAGIRLGQLVGRQNDGRLVGVRRSIDLLTLLNRATNSVRIEVSRGFLYCPGAPNFRRPVDAEGISLSCDAPLVESILVNLYRNALKYSIPDRTGQTEVVTLVTRPASRTVQVSIRNFGTKIADNSEELIFHPFVRFVEQEASSVGRRGMGLGLFLARNIARAHGGDTKLQMHEPLTRAQAEGFASIPVYQTAFSFTLRTDLSPGSYTYALREDTS